MVKVKQNSKDTSTLLKESLVDYNNLASNIKEDINTSVKDFLSENVKEALANILAEAEDEEEEIDGVDEVEDTEEDSETADTDAQETETEEENPENMDDIESEVDDLKSGEDGTEEELPSEPEEGLGAEFDAFKDEAGRYDLQKADDTDLVKVYKRLKDDDTVTVVYNDNKVNISDNEADTEYIIDLGTSDNENEEFEDMNESVIYEIALGYTENYQGGTAMEGTTTSETPKGMRDIDKGVPFGNKKPYGKKGSQAPFTEKVKGGMSEKTKAHNRTHHVDAKHNKINKHDRTSFNKVDESMVKVEHILAENKKLEKQVNELAKLVQESAVTNVNLGSIIKLISENATTKDEKKDIIKRFTNQATTIEESQKLFATISEELQKMPKANLTESKENEEKEIIKESKLYQDDGLKESLGLMHRLGL